MEDPGGGPPATPVRITVLAAQELRAIKSDFGACRVQRSHPGRLLLPNGTASFNFTTSFECSPDEPNSLDDIVQKPVLCKNLTPKLSLRVTVIEVLQKEKKQKKTVPLGQAVVDLLPLLQGQCSSRVSAPLWAVPTLPLESLHPEAKKEFPLLFTDDILKLAGEKEPLPRPKKWPLGNFLAPGALIILNSFIVGGLYEGEDGELNKREDREFRIQAESSKRIVWDVERCCYLGHAAAVSLQKRIMECRYWPVEVCCGLTQQRED